MECVGLVFRLSALGTIFKKKISNIAIKNRVPYIHGQIYVDIKYMDWNE